MAYDLTKKVTVKQLKTTTGQVKTYVDDSTIAKVSEPTENNLPKLTSAGALADSGVAVGDVVTKVASATENNLPKLDSNGKIADSGIASADVVTKVSGATTGNLPKLDANGKIVDSGIAYDTVITSSEIATDAEVQEMLTEVLGTTAPAEQSGSGSGEQFSLTSTHVLTLWISPGRYFYSAKELINGL